MEQDGRAEPSGYTLYWEAMSGAMAVEFVLEEMCVPYTRRPVDMAAGEHLSADYLKINPTGQVPALALPDNRVIGESAAIILTLGDRHPDTGLVPAADATERPNFLRWLIYMAASPYMTFVQFNHPERYLENPATHDALIDNARQRLEAQFSAIDAAISGEPYFFPTGPSALDFYIYMLVAFYPEPACLLAERARLRLLIDALSRHESVAKVIPRHAGQV